MNELSPSVPPGAARGERHEIAAKNKKMGGGREAKGNANALRTLGHRR